MLTYVLAYHLASKGRRKEGEWGGVRVRDRQSKQGQEARGTWKGAEAASVIFPAGNRSPPQATETSSMQGLLMIRCSRELRENHKGMVGAAPWSW